MKANSKTKISRLRWLYVLLLIICITIVLFMVNIFFNFVNTSLKVLPKTECSLDHIDICQSHGLGTDGTFLHVMAGNMDFGSEMNQLLLAFAYSVTTRRQFLIDDEQWKYGSFHKYFDIGTRHCCDLPYDYRMLERSAARNQQVTHLKSTATSEKLSDLWIATKEVQNLATQRKVAQYLWKHMSNSLSITIQKCKHRNEQGKSYIGIQMLCADKVGEELMEVFRKYTSAIESLLETNVFVPIFVASDDHRALRELQRLRRDWQLFGFEMESVLTINEGDNSEEDLNPSPENMNRFDLKFLICQIQMLIHADIVFCSETSTLCQLVQVLREQPPETLIWVD